MSALFLNHPKETDLALFAGGELGPLARWRIERHIETCKECEETVADFFHLADELSPLAEVPDLDWAAMQRNIEAGLAVAAAQPDPRRAIPAWAWQLGAAAACAVVAVAVWNVRPAAEPKLARAPEAEQTAANEVAADKPLAAQSVSAPAETRTGQTEEMRRIAAPARQVAQAIAEEAAAEPKPLLEKKKEALKPVTLALADRADEAFSTDAAAPPAPPPPPAMKAPAMEAESDSVAAGQFRAREASQVGGRVAPGLSAAGFAEGAGFYAQSATFEITPLPAAGEDMRVGADGWVSVRAINADGAMTITDVYEPQ